MKKLNFVVIPLMALPLLMNCGEGDKPSPTHIDWYENESFINSLAEEDVGTLQQITINKMTYNVRLIGIDHDDLADGSGKAHTTWEFENLISDSNGYSLATTWNCSKDESSTNDYLNSSLRKAIDGGGDAELCWYEKGSNVRSNTYTKPVIDMLPDKLKKQLKKVKKPIARAEQEYKIEMYDTELFPLSYHEMTSNDFYRPFEGTTYQYYQGDDTKGAINRYRIKWQIQHYQGAITSPTEITDGVNDSWNFAGFNHGGAQEGGYYWVRSPRVYMTNLAWFVYSDGSFDNGGACIYSRAQSVAPAFCL